MYPATRPVRNRHQTTFRTVWIGMVFCVAATLSCAPKSTPDPATNTRWQNYLKENAGETQAGAAAYQRRQAELARKKAGGTTKTGTPPTTAKSPAGMPSTP